MWKTMYKSCSRCGRIHQAGVNCNVGRKWDNARYNEKRMRSSWGWKNKSEEIRANSHYLCSMCLQEGIYNYRELEVHHITKLKEAPDKLLDNYNLVCLCKHHHKLADAGLIDKAKLLEIAKDREESE